MKIRLILFILIIISGLSSCIKDHPAPQVLKTSERNLHFSGDGGAWLLTVNSNTNWEIKGTTDWCTVDKETGYNTQNIIITVEANDTQIARSTNLQILSELHNTDISIQQDTISGEYHYQLPVIFHIIYSDLSDTLQNVKPEVISELISGCNRLFQNTNVDMNMELIPATQDPDGKELTEPGIHRVLRSSTAYKNSESFFKGTGDTDLMWDPNQYVNVYVFTFVESNVTGRTTLPFTPRQNSLPGLDANNTYYTKLPATPYGIALNNRYITDEDAYRTMAHELGHYVGLLHAFAVSDCELETDYCDDTPNYNRKEYESWLSSHTDLTDQQKKQRQGCDGTEFTSYNIMDYDYSYREYFTADQFLRVRHVLEHSPLIPGPKDIIVTKGLVKETEIPEIRTLE